MWTIGFAVFSDSYTVFLSRARLAEKVFFCETILLIGQALTEVITQRCRNA